MKHNSVQNKPLPPLGLSVYLSHFEEMAPWLKKHIIPGTPIFTSLHIPEEESIEQSSLMTQMMSFLTDLHSYHIVDISNNTCAFYGQSIEDIAHKYDIDNVRVDFGIDDQTIQQWPESLDVTLNASTQINTPSSTQSRNWYAMHNYYPRPETGLDWNDVYHLNQSWIEKGIHPMGFISGDHVRRGPIKQGLPTIESHRNLPPYVQYLDWVIRLHTPHVFIGDPDISETQWNLIQSYRNNHIVKIPIDLAPLYHDLYNQSFTLRVDTPRYLWRLVESRGRKYSKKQLEPQQCIERIQGMLTLDNILYSRYQGELQILKDRRPQDSRINVIGEIKSNYLPLLDIVQPGTVIEFIEPSTLK